MRLHKTGAKASSLSRCTHITTSAFGTLPIPKAYSIQSIIDNNEDLKATDVFQKSTALKSKTNTLENEIDHKKDRNYIASGLSKINGQVYDQETISYARKVSSQLSSCGNFCWINSKTQEVRGYMRCKSHACPVCIQKKLNLRIKDFNEGLSLQDLANADYDFVSLVTFVFVRKSNHHTDMRKQSKALSKAGSKILGYRKFKENVFGSARSIEAPESKRHEGDAHIHLHLLAMHKKEFLFSPRELEKKVSRLVGEEVRVHVRTEKKEDNESDALEQLKRGFNYTLKVFGLKEKKRTEFHPTFGKVDFTAVREQSIGYYLNWTRASKGLRLYNCTGFIRETLRLGKEHRVSSLDAPFLPTDETDTHQRTNEVLLFWKRHEITINGVTHDLGSYYVSSVYFDSFSEEMKVMLPPKSKVFLNQKEITKPSSKLMVNNPPSTIRMEHWRKKESQLELNFNKCQKALKSS